MALPYRGMTSKQVQTGIAVVVALSVVGIFFLAFNPFFFVDPQNSLQPAGAALSHQLIAQDDVVGTGAEATPGSVLTVHYTGRLENGVVFDSSVGSTPFAFQLGVGSVIQGWDQGLVGMKVGGKRTLIVPPELAYGFQDYGPIPGGSTLVFEVELLRVDPASAQ